MTNTKSQSLTKTITKKWQSLTNIQREQMTWIAMSTGDDSPPFAAYASSHTTTLVRGTSAFVDGVRVRVCVCACESVCV